MNSYLVSPGIRFNDCLFTEPKQLGGWVPPRCAGVFVILAGDPNWAPKPYQPVFFGEFGNNSRELLLPHDLRLAGRTGPPILLASVLAMPFSTTAQRAEVCRQLIWAYNPTCQATGTANPSNNLARKLEELEKKHEEQSTYLQLLLANASKLFEAPSLERPRRQIGFLPPPVTATN